MYFLLDFMNINGKAWRTIWLEEDGKAIGVIDQTKLPHRFSQCILKSSHEVAGAIRTMVVRGAPLIGVAGAYGLMLALQVDQTDEALITAFNELNATRPTAVNLQWALKRVVNRVMPLALDVRVEAAREEANLIAEEDIAMCEAIGEYGLKIFQQIGREKLLLGKSEPLRILTHCNAGWLATVDWGTALSPIYKAHRSGLNIHVWVDETRPRNQGASLTAFELGEEGVPHTVIVDNAGGYLMQQGKVDAVIVGTDRTTRKGDVCNKIGTYLKALAAYDNEIPFYVALPASTIDWSLSVGLAEIIIEERASDEVTKISGLLCGDHINDEIVNVRLTPAASKGFNPAFDITPARLITALITDRGISPANEHGLKRLYLDKSSKFEEI